MIKASLEAAVIAFQLSYDQDSEYGISDEDAAKGLREVFAALGIAYEDDIVLLHGKLSNREEVAADEQKVNDFIIQRNAWRMSHPEEAARSDMIDALLNNSLNRQIEENIFSSHQLFKTLVNGTFRGEPDKTQEQPTPLQQAEMLWKKSQESLALPSKDEQ